MSNDPQYTFYSPKVPHAGKMKNRRCVLCKHTGDCSLSLFTSQENNRCYYSLNCTTDVIAPHSGGGRAFSCVCIIGHASSARDPAQRKTFCGISLRVRTAVRSRRHVFRPGAGSRSAAALRTDLVCPASLPMRIAQSDVRPPTAAQPSTPFFVLDLPAIRLASELRRTPEMSCRDRSCWLRVSSDRTVRRIHAFL